MEERLKPRHKEENTTPDLDAVMHFAQENSFVINTNDDTCDLSNCIPILDT